MTQPIAPYARYRCLRCGKANFQFPIPHKCGKNYLKHYGKESYKKEYNGSIWRIVNHLGFSVLG